MAETRNINKERWIWGILITGISTVFGALLKSNANYTASLERTVKQRDATITAKDSSCAQDKRSMASYYEGVIKNKDSTILALKDDKYRSVLDLLNVKKVNGKIKIEQ
ncbi:hypothetical protein SAMN05192529_13134 [Arachidicoccus rhizosphaerae]|uniref:Uncharacterized protein n=1 Tax=Arachidicoccus rhizosphaerae TaxID=551991 RepID=A0A1H4CFY8_9BACT|nr:hypothetical protein [Arachidicoccus rhizosphaerae]SEA59268.1 hypothetical protein SAMN05192529_13134 [Arachidicoccus rhizosphaerae]